MLSFGFIFLLAVGSVIAAIFVSAVIVGMMRYIRGDDRQISVSEWGHYSGGVVAKAALVECPKFKAPERREYIHISGPWHG